MLASYHFLIISLYVIPHNGEGGIWTLAPLLTTYSLSRGAPSASLGTSPILLARFILSDSISAVNNYLHTTWLHRPSIQGLNVYYRIAYLYNVENQCKWKPAYSLCHHLWFHERKSRISSKTIKSNQNLQLHFHQKMAALLMQWGCTKLYNFSLKTKMLQTPWNRALGASSWNGEGGIRTHAPSRTNGFQDRLVMTTSIPLHLFN